MLKDTRLADLEIANANYRKQLAEAEERIKTLELLAGGASGASPESSAQPSDLRTRALELRENLERDVNALESGGNGETSP